jgi:hypothetical protein
LSICGAYVDACSCRCSQNGRALAVAGSATAAAETKSAARRSRAARAADGVFFTAR